MLTVNLCQVDAKRLAQLCVFLLSVLLSGAAFSEQIYVFTLNPSFSALSKNQAKMIFRGKSTVIDGHKITLLDLPENSAIRHDFYKNLLRKNARQMQVQWASLEFSGKPSTPDELPKDDFRLLLDWLQENPFGIAYYTAPLPSSNVNVLYKQDIK